tara:strand:- start:178 stop:420 length:243 start_codon:yes stop_codon:yes gene_type:complete
MGIGVLLRYVLVAIIVLYLINKVGKFFTKIFLGDNSESTKNAFGKKAANFKETTSSQAEKDSSTNKKFTAGEYVDYEELD